MKIVISDYPYIMDRDLEYEISILKRIKDAEVVIYEYTGNKEEFISVIEDADSIITAYIKLDKEVLSRAKNLKVISINATGYNIVDLEEAKKRNIAVCALDEYCTEEVADHTMALILALARGLKYYEKEIEEKRVWKYYSIGSLKRLSGLKLGIFGFGKIGKAVAKRAQIFGINILVFNHHISKEEADKLGVKLSDEDFIYENADIISNHMSQNSSNTDFFSIDKFKKMKRKPIFINVGRGDAVIEDDLAYALDNNLISGAGLDVLKGEGKCLENNKLLNRENVIITPHAAFYSEDSIKDLQRISCENVVYYLTGQVDKVCKIITPY